MLKQVIALSSEGPCYVSRNYNRDNDSFDPQLVSAMVSLSSTGKISLSAIKDILQAEGNENLNYVMEVSNTYNYITCAISDGEDENDALRKVLPKINQMIYEVIGNPYQLTSIHTDKIKKMEDRIDLILTKAGIVGT